MPHQYRTGIPGSGDDDDDGADNNIYTFELEDSHGIKENDASTRRKYVRVVAASLFTLLFLSVGYYGVHNGVRYVGAHWGGFSKNKEPSSPKAATAVVGDGGSAAGGTRTDENLENIGNVEASTTSEPLQIFCYGDSLTFGMSSGGTYPYGDYLERELNGLFDDEADSTSSSPSNGPQRNATIVKHFGLPGFTASTMLNHLHDNDIGICSIVDRNPTVSVMVILAGSNDVGQMTDAGKSVARAIVESIIDLHKGAIKCAEDSRGNSAKPELNVGFRTLAVGIPGSAYQENVRIASELTSYINSALRVFASTYPGGEVSYVDFPFPYDEEDGKWDKDGLHLTEEGYHALGKELAPHVKTILDSTH